MAEILSNVSPTALRQAIEENMFAFRSNFGLLPGSELHDDIDKLWYINSIPHPIFNTIYRARFDSDNVDAQIEQAVAPYRERGLPVNWWVGPTSAPPNLGQHLIHHGLTLHGETRGMAALLTDLKDTVHGVPDLQIKQVDSVEHLCQYMEVFSSFNLPTYLNSGFYDLYAALALPRQIPWFRYVAYLAGRPVAISDMYFGAGVAGIYSVTTIPELRRQGIGAAVTHHALRCARDNGFQIAILQSTEIAYRMYASLGFQEYCTLTYYHYPAESTM